MRRYTESDNHTRWISESSEFGIRPISRVEASKSGRRCVHVCTPMCSHGFTGRCVLQGCTVSTQAYTPRIGLGPCNVSAILLVNPIILASGKATWIFDGNGLPLHCYTPCSIPGIPMQPVFSLNFENIIDV